MGERRFGAITFETSNEDKVLFPDDGITKGDLIEHSARIAPVMLPHVEGRPVTMQRFPDGIDEDGFYQKSIPDHFPDWVDRAPLPKEDGTTTYVLCEKAATLAYLANQGCITPHVWLARRDEPRSPDRLVVDLDPSDDDFEKVRRAARIVADAFDEIGLAVFLQLTGSRGIHVVSPIRRGPDFDEVRGVAQKLARRLAEARPDELTVEQRKAKRGDRVYLDVARNAYGQTMVAPYSVRAKPGAPVATPIRLDELDDPDLAPRRYTIKTIFRRLGRMDDPWSGMGRSARSIEDADARLADGGDA